MYIIKVCACMGRVILWKRPLNFFTVTGAKAYYMEHTPVVFGLLVAPPAAPRGAYSVRAADAARSDARDGVCLGCDSAAVALVYYFNYFNYFINFNYYFNTQANIGNYARAVDPTRVPPPPPPPHTRARIRKPRYRNEPRRRPKADCRLCFTLRRKISSSRYQPRPCGRVSHFLQTISVKHEKHAFRGSVGGVRQSPSQYNL